MTKNYVDKKKQHKISKYKYEAEAYLSYFTEVEPNTIQQERLKGILEAIEYIMYIIQEE